VRISPSPSWSPVPPLAGLVCNPYLGNLVAKKKKCLFPFQIGYATINITVFEEPAAGDCYLRINGTKAITGREQAYYDLFTLKCENWEDEFEWPMDPLRYRFFALDPDGNGRVSLNTGQYDKSSVDFFLPPGTTQLQVEITSQSGALYLFNLSAVATLVDHYLLALAPEEVAFWLQSVKLQPCLFKSGTIFIPLHFL